MYDHVRTGLVYMSIKWPVLTFYFLSLSLGGHKFSSIFFIPFFFLLKSLSFHLFGTIQLKQHI